VRGTVLYGPRDVRFEERPDPTIIEPTDAIIRTSAACVCGSEPLHRCLVAVFHLPVLLTYRSKSRDHRVRPSPVLHRSSTVFSTKR
jgi:hypothetical protein